MPTTDTLNRFIACVEAGQFVQAIEDFYHPDASMQENEHPPHRGRSALIQHERSNQSWVRPVRARCVRPPLAQDNVVVIRWVYEFESLEGRHTRFEELAYQCWQGGGLPRKSPSTIRRSSTPPASPDISRGTRDDRWRVPSRMAWAAHSQ